MIVLIENKLHIPNKTVQNYKLKKILIMKKTVLIAKITLWLAYLVFIIVLVVRKFMPSIESRSELTCLLLASGAFMFLAFYLLVMSTSPKPIIKPGRLYTLERVISHNYKDHTVMLSYGNDVEIFRCQYLSPFESLKTGNKYTVQSIDGDLIFTAV